jgi:hypothetical protein
MGTSMSRFGYLAGTLIALVLLGLALTGSASATALCEDPPTENVCGASYPKEAELVGKSTNATLKTSIANVTCKESTMAAKTSEEATEAGAALNAQVSSLTFAGCEISGGTSCTITGVHLPFSAKFNWTTGSKGTFSIESGAGGSSPGMTVVCGLILNCTLSGALTLDANGGEAGKATIVAFEETMASGGGFCPKSATWSGTYTLSKPEEGRVFLAQKANPVLTAGGAGAAGVAVNKKDLVKTAGGSTINFEGPGGVSERVGCNNSEIGGKVLTNPRAGNAGATVSVTSWDVLNVPACFVNIVKAGITVLEVKVIKFNPLPYTLELKDTTNLPLKFTAAAENPWVEFQFRITPGTVIETCVYEASEIPGRYKNAASTIEVNAAPLAFDAAHSGSSGVCPASMNLTVSYTPFEDTTRAKRIFVN